MDEQQKPPRHGSWLLSSLELGDSAALGGDVRLDLHPRTTVLVGRNGAGKSALMEKIIGGADGATGVVEDGYPDPGRFACEICRRNQPESVVRYACRWRPSQAEGSIESLPPDERRKQGDSYAEIAEICSIRGGEVLWELKDGLLRRNDGSTDTLPPGRGLLNYWWSRRRPFVFDHMVEPLNDILYMGMFYVRAGVPRADKGREAVIVPYPWPFTGAAKLERRYAHISRGIRELTLDLASWHEHQRSSLGELVEIGRRLGIFSIIEVSVFPNPEHAADVRAPPQLAAVSVDGINLGLLSDGTLRVMEILSALINPTISLLLVEEPEIAVHPGLLARLLEEVDAYSVDRQVILSTQSPQVVSWAQPDALRLVERIAGTTSVRSLNDEEHSRVERYLRDEGTLGEYLYAGGIDG
jgi:hypothetical protein